MDDLLDSIYLPSFTEGLLILTIAVILTPFASVLYNLTLHPLSSYPGPILYRASRLPWVLSLQRGTMHLDLLALHNQYGPIIRIAPNELSYIDSQAWRDIYLNPRIARPAIWFKNEPGESGSIMSASEEMHSKYRRAFSGGFNDRSMKEHAETLEVYVGLMVRKFRELCDASGKGVTVDIVEWLNFLTFDVSGDLSFGQSFGSTENGKAHPWVAISTGFGKGVAIAASLSFLPTWVKSLMKAIMPEGFRRKMEYHKQLCGEKVKERMESGRERRDYVQSVMDYNADAGVKEKGRQLSVAELNTNMPVFIFAGSETTSSALASTLWYLLRNPVWMERVKREVRDCFENEQDVTVARTGDLEILTAVINEGMRLGPPSVIGVPRQVGKGGETICGRFVPGGTLLAISQYPAFRSAVNFNHPETFDPSRFLSASEDTYAIFHPFLAGRHICIGQKFAWAEMRLILARLLFSFDLALGQQSGETEELTDWGQQKTFIFWEKQRLFVGLTLRSE